MTNTKKYKNSDQRLKDIQDLYEIMKHLRKTSELVSVVINRQAHLNSKDNHQEMRSDVQREVAEAILQLLTHRMELYQHCPDETMRVVNVVLNSVADSTISDDDWFKSSEKVWESIVDTIPWERQISNMIGNYTDWPEVMEIMLGNYENDYDELTQALARAMGNDSCAMQELAVRLIQLSANNKTETETKETT